MKAKSKSPLADYRELIPHLIIQGDNRIVLPALLNRYKEKVACVYIDPPYNNGEDYEFYTDITSHTKWLDQMEKTLRALWPLLKEDGSLWISIDDGEMHYLKILCDNLFGREKFVSTIIWQQRNTRENRKAFSNNHEYLLVYSPNPDKYKKRRNLLPLTGEVMDRYKNPDNDPRGPWQSVSLNVQDGHAVASQFYTIVAPNGKKHDPPAGRCWVYNEERMKREIEQNNVWFGSDGNGVPRLKKFLSESKRGLVPETLWLADFAGTNKDAKTHLNALKIYDKKLFDTPKPEQLIQRIISISTNEEEIVLDSFLGSGTTITAAHKMNRGYIGIEMSDVTCNYIIQRMDKVIQGEKGGISKSIDWHGGGTYQFIKWTK